MLAGRSSARDLKSSDTELYGVRRVGLQLPLRHWGLISSDDILRAEAGWLTRHKP